MATDSRPRAVQEPSLRLPAVSPLSRRERVAGILRDAIISGELQPGQRLTEGELSAQLGTSRAPVREALRQLELEGLTVSHPYRGTEVLGVSQEEIDQVLVPVRVVLERFAFAKASAQIDAVAEAELAGIVAEMEASADDPARLADTDIRFHEFIIRLSQQPHCLQIWKSIQPRVRAYFYRDARYYDDPSDVAEQHRKLLAALKTGDEAEIVSGITEHIHIHFSEGRL